MQYRKLGKSGVSVGVIGLGAEYLWDFALAKPVPLETVTALMDEALARGLNYFDVCLPAPGVRNNVGAALKGRRQDAVIAGHLGAVLDKGRYTPHRDRELSEKFFHDLLRRLQTDYVDVLMVHCVDDPADLEKTFSPEGLLGMAQRLKQEGKARLLGMSGHSVPTALKAVQSGQIDVLMFPVNPATDVLPGDIRFQAGWEPDTFEKASQAPQAAIPSRHDLYHTCAALGIGVVGMKPYAAGRLFKPENPSSIVLTPVQCAAYALSQPAVACIVPGCKNVAEMKAALAYLDATDAQKDYSGIDANNLWKLRGACMYCNHCLPCPEAIDVAVTTRLADTAAHRKDAKIVAEYGSLPVHASACVECGACTDRCPFGVDVVANMKRAVALFGR